jgi:hypothetical protein
MKTTMSLLTETYLNEQSGEEVEGVTVMLDGLLLQVVQAILVRKPEYQASVDVIQDALVRGLDEIRKEV